MVTTPIRTLALLLTVGSVASCVGYPFYNSGPVGTEPKFFVAGHDGSHHIAIAGVLSACVQGRGEALLVTTNADVSPIETIRRIPCSTLKPLDARELREALDSHGYSRASGMIPLTRKPLFTQLDRGIYALAGRVGPGNPAYPEYFVSYTDSKIRLVSWNRSQCRGTETGHTYSVNLGDNGPVLETHRSTTRTVRVGPCDPWK